MKRLMLTIAVFGLLSFSANAQRFCYVDTEYILSKMPEYQDAQKQLDQVAENWQGEVQKMMDEVDKLYRAYQAEEVLLTDDLRMKREEEIIEKERAIKEYQKAKFGYQGELFKKRQELVKPIQDEVYAAIQELAEMKAYDFIFDKSSGASILFAADKYDKSKDVLKKLGIKVTE